MNEVLVEAVSSGGTCDEKKSSSVTDQKAGSVKLYL